MKKLLIAAALLLGISPAFGQASYIIKDGNGAFQTIKSFNCSSVICPGSVPMDQTGAPFGVSANPFAMTFGSGVTLPGFTAAPSVKLQDGSGNVISSSGGSLNVNITGGGSGGGAVFGPTAAGSAAANPPIVVGGTADGTATGLVRGTTVLPASGTATAPNTSLVVQLNPNSPGLVTLGTAGAPSSSVMTVQGIGGGTAVNVTGTFFQTTQPISVASLPLPTGAATAAKQPALGTAGSSSSDVLSIQGIASMTPLASSQSGTWNITNVSGTISLPTGAATAANQTNASQKTQIVDGSGNVIASTSNNLNVQCANCSGSGVSTADGATFTAGSSLFAGSGGIFQTTATSNLVTNGHQGLFQMTAQRSLFVNLRDSSGTEISPGTAANQATIITALGTVNTNLGTINTSINSPLPTQVPSISIGGVGIIDSAGTNKATVKAASTAAATTDTALVVALSPNNPVTITPGTTGGWSKWSTPKNNSNTALTNSVVQVKGSAGTFGGYFVPNVNSATACLQIFDAATAGAVTLGTTRPDLVYCFPASANGPGGGNLEIANGVNFASGIQVAWTTTASGSTAPSTGADVSLYFK